jgi:CheY-like chemotaxis protein
MPKTLLLADDSVTIQKVVGISFANEDVALLTVDNGDDAIARARETRPDIVLADVVMPGMNGYEVCEAIKSDPELHSTPVLLLTGTFEAFDEERAARAGADGHVTKPFEAQALVDQVNARLAQVTAPALAPELTPAGASPGPLEQTPALGDSLGPHAAPGISSEGGESFDFFDEEITEPRTASASSAETLAEGDDLVGGGEAEDAFAFEASDDLHDEMSSSFSSSPGAEIDARDGMMEPLAAAEMAPDSTVAILPEDDAFEGALTEPPTARPILGESDLAEPEEPSATPEAPLPLDGLSSSLPEASAPTHVMHETEALDPSPDPTSEAISIAPDETLILSDLDTDPLGGPTPGDALGIAEAAPAGGLADDPLAQVEPDDLAVKAVLDPAGGRDWDVSSSDLGDPLQGVEMASEAAEEEQSSPWPAEQPVLAEGELLPESAPDDAPEPAPDLLATAAEDAPAPSVPSAADLSPLAREQLHDALEKIAWEAFGGVTEQIVKEALERIERVAWEVIPQMAEALILEEIRKLKGEDG